MAARPSQCLYLFYQTGGATVIIYFLHETWSLVTIKPTLIFYVMLYILQLLKLAL